MTINALLSSTVETHLFDPTPVGSDWLGPDPFGWRDPALMAHSKSEPPFTPNESSMNFIWMGSDFSRPDFRENLESFAIQYHPKGLETLLWVDQPQSAETIEWAETQGIRILHLSDYFTEIDPDLAAIHALYDHKLPSNYGALSNLYRFLILDKFGGFYFDVDLKVDDFQKVRFKFGKPYLPLDLTETLSRKVDLLVCDEQNLSLRVDFFFMRERSTFARRCLNKIIIRHERSVDYETTQWVNRFLRETSQKTGSGIVRSVFKDSLGSTENPRKVIKKRTPTARSWTPSKVKVIRRPLNQLFEGIISEILWDLRNVPNRVDLGKFEPILLSVDNRDKLEGEIITYLSTYYSGSIEAIKHIYTGNIDTYRRFKGAAEPTTHELRKAIRNEHTQMAKHLLKLGLDALAVGGKTGMKQDQIPPLMCAYQMQNLELLNTCVESIPVGKILRILEKDYPGISKYTPNDYNALSIAFHFDDPKRLQFILGLGIKLPSILINRALVYNCPKIIEFLHARGQIATESSIQLIISEYNEANDYDSEDEEFLTREKLSPPHQYFLPHVDASD